MMSEASVCLDGVMGIWPLAVGQALALNQVANRRSG